MSKNGVWKIISSQFLPLYPLYWPERFSSWGSHNENLGLVDQSRNPWGFSQKKLPSINDTNTNLSRHQRATLRWSENVKMLKSVTFTDACFNSINRCFSLNEKPLISINKARKAESRSLGWMAEVIAAVAVIRCEVCESSAHVQQQPYKHGRVG